MRADAAENRRKILRAARAAFAEKGLAATTDEIADRAGVGKGTLYRRFGNKYALLEAVLDDLTSEFEALVPAEHLESEPGLSLKKFLVDSAGFYCRHAGFFETVIAEEGEEGLPGELRERLIAACETVLQNSRKLGTVRGDITPIEVLRLSKMVAVAGRMGDSGVSVEDLDRYSDLIFEGLHP